MDSSIFIATLLSACVCCYGRYLRPYAISSEPESVYDAISRNTDLQYNDETHHVTALRDVALRSCYITSYDPEWALDGASKVAIMESVEPHIMRSQVLLNSFINRVGPVVGILCKTSKVYFVSKNNTKVKGDTKDQSIPKSAQPPPRKIYHDSDPVMRRPQHIRVPTKRPQFQHFRIPHKRPQHVDRHESPPGNMRRDRFGHIVPMPSRQLIPHLRGYQPRKFERRNRAMNVAPPTIAQGTPRMVYRGTQH